ncbi:MAG: antibiotic biosynthesis monooxygenase [Armatimonadetes bacterium]|nr:antibiotic biosynthesis monooxygenase [Armatimonadota bacterium]
MITVANRIPVAEGYEAEFEKRFQSRAGLVEGMAGFIRNEVLRPIKGNSYIVLTHWESRETFEAWTKSDAFRLAHSSHPPREMFSGPNVLEIHEVILSKEAPVEVYERR